MHEQQFLDRHIAYTNPEYVMYVPKYKDYESDNVHLHVVEHPQFGGLIAFWTQSTIEGAGDNHAMMSRSTDGGKTWSEAKFIIGAKPSRDKKEKQAHWAFPAVSKSGRIYLFYYREMEVIEFNRQITGIFSCIYSDNFGDTWSESYDVPLRVTPFDRNGQLQDNCCYQMPRRFADGKYLFGYSKYTNLPYDHGVDESDPAAVRTNDYQDSRIYFARLENLDDDPLPCNLKITHLPDDEMGISVQQGKNGSCAQEPAIVQLPDGRLLCTLRNIRGSVYYIVSGDMGHTWSQPEPMCFDDGNPIAHPLSPCPIYRLEENRYVLLFHGAASDDVWGHRNPIRRMYGVYDPLSHQPIRFAAGSDTVYMELPEEGRGPGQYELAMYGCYVKQDGKDILWYPDRKFFLLGKEL